MFARYVQISAVVIVVALATGYVVHRVAGTSNFTAACQFQLALPVTSTVPSSDILVFNRRQALDEIDRAELTSVWAAVAKDTGVAQGDVAAAQSIQPASDSSFDVLVTYSAGDRAVKLANSLCRRYVKQLTGQVSAEQANETSGLRAQLRQLDSSFVALNKSAGHHVTPLYLEERSAIVGAIDRTKQLLIVAYSLPPDNISVLSTANAASPHTTKPSLSKSLIVAAAAGLLASFLLVLTIETARGRRDEES
jgi:hypothetical protein